MFYKNEKKSTDFLQKYNNKQDFEIKKKCLYHDELIPFFEHTGKPVKCLFMLLVCYCLKVRNLSFYSLPHRDTMVT